MTYLLNNYFLKRLDFEFIKKSKIKIVNILVNVSKFISVHEATVMLISCWLVNIFGDVGDKNDQICHQHRAIYSKHIFISQRINANRQISCELTWRTSPVKFLIRRMLYNLSRLDLYIGNDCPGIEINSVKARQRLILS